MTDHGGDPGAVSERAHELIVEMITPLLRRRECRRRCGASA